MGSVEVAVNGPLATVSLNRPEVRNAFNAEMIEDLTAAVAELSQRDELRVLVLQGNGKVFSAGADANWMRASLDYSLDENRADALRMSDMFAALQECSIPVIARVHGAALGGGMGLLAACDIVVAADDAIFGFTETKLGIIPAVISRVVYPKIGPSWARALYVTGERFGADVARQIGLVHWIVPGVELDAAVATRVSELQAGGPIASRQAKRLALSLAAQNESERREYTAGLIAELRASSEGQEGLRAFLERRDPAWRSGE